MQAPDLVDALAVPARAQYTSRMNRMYLTLMRELTRQVVYDIAWYVKNEFGQDIDAAIDYTQQRLSECCQRTRVIRFGHEIERAKVISDDEARMLDDTEVSIGAATAVINGTKVGLITELLDIDTDDLDGHFPLDADFDDVEELLGCILSTIGEEVSGKRKSGDADTLPSLIRSHLNEILEKPDRYGVNAKPNAERRMYLLVDAFCDDDYRHTVHDVPTAEYCVRTSLSEEGSVISCFIQSIIEEVMQRIIDVTDGCNGTPQELLLIRNSLKTTYWSVMGKIEQQSKELSVKSENDSGDGDKKASSEDGDDSDGSGTVGSDDDFAPSIDVDRLPSSNDMSRMVSNSLATLYDDIKCELGCDDEATIHHLRNVIEIAFDGMSDDMLMSIADDQSIIFDDIAVSYSMPPEYVVMTPASTDDATDIEPCKRYVVELDGDCLTRNTCRLTATTGEVQLEYASEKDIIDFA